MPSFDIEKAIPKMSTSNPLRKPNKLSILEQHEKIVETRGRSKTGACLKSKILKEIDEDENAFKYGCSMRHVLFLVFNFILICVQAAIIVLFSSTPSKLLGHLHRDGLWVFFVFLGILTVIFVKHSCCYSCAARKIIRASVNNELRSSVIDAIDGNKEGGGSDPTMLDNIMTKFVQFKEFKKSFDMSGKYFLLKMALVETFEDVNQFYNIATIHLCSLPLGFVIALLCGIFVEVTYRTYTYGKSLKPITLADMNTKRGKKKWESSKNFNSWKIKKPGNKSKTQGSIKRISLSNTAKLTLITIGQRNKQVFSDMLLDAIFLVVPIGALYVNKIDLAIIEVIWLVLMPTISLAFKLNDLLNNDLEERMDTSYNTVLSMKFKKQGKERSRYMGLKRMEIVCAEQNLNFPRSVKLFFLAFNGLLSVLIVVMIIFYATQWSLIGYKCNEMLGETIWEKGCKIKVPFCTNVFKPTCDCCSFYIDGHNYTQLPGGIKEFTAIRRFVLKNGALKYLPKKNLETWNRINTFDLQNNMLASFQINVSLWPSLVLLNLRFNHLRNISTETWRHRQLVNLMLNSNIGLRIPSKLDEKVDIRMPSLRFLSIANNSVRLPTHFGYDEFPNLAYLYMNHNIVAQFPDNFHTLNKLLKVSLAGSEISAIPQYFSKFNQLQLIDFRNNNISALSSDIRVWLKAKIGESQGNTKKFEQLFANNPICKNIANKNLEFLDCAPVCSQFCYSRNALGNNLCDFTCNSKACEYDKGDCKK
jgi:hypothetical protein